MFISKVLELVRERERPEGIVKEIVAKLQPKCEEGNEYSDPKAQTTPNKMNPKKSTPRLIVIKTEDTMKSAR
jgi:hypothetical protein